MKKSILSKKKNEFVAPKLEVVNFAFDDMIVTITVSYDPNGALGAEYYFDPFGEA